MGDEGDCCGKSGDNLQFEYCKECKCLDPSKKKEGCPGSGSCGAKAYLGDKRCDDENNNCGCNWDNGDCCGKSGDNLQFAYCKACKCLDPAKKKDKKKSCDGTCATPGWKGDKRCDDGNNNCGAAGTVATAVERVVTNYSIHIAPNASAKILRKLSSVQGPRHV